MDGSDLWSYLAVISALWMCNFNVHMFLDSTFSPPLWQEIQNNVITQGYCNEKIEWMLSVKDGGLVVPVSTHLIIHSNEHKNLIDLGDNLHHTNGVRK